MSPSSLKLKRYRGKQGQGKASSSRTSSIIGCFISTNNLLVIILLNWALMRQSPVLRFVASYSSSVPIAGSVKARLVRPRCSSRLHRTIQQRTIPIVHHHRHPFKCMTLESSFTTSTSLLRSYKSNSYPGDGTSNENTMLESDTMEMEQQQRTEDVQIIQTIHNTLCQQIIPQLQTHHNHNDDDTTQPTITQQSISDSLVILIGVSGGCDSMALFHSIIILLSQQSNSNQDTTPPTYSLNCAKCADDKPPTPPPSDSDHAIPCTIHVVHFDHTQRGVDSDGDRLLVQKLCTEYNVPFHCFTWGDDDDTNSTTDTTTPPKKFSQESAREWRRTTSLKLLTNIMNRSSSSNEQQQPPHQSQQEGDNHHYWFQRRRHGVIMTAHHKDDSEETILLKLLRGVHITNLSGMDVLQPAPLQYSTDDDCGDVVVPSGSGERLHHKLYFAKPMIGVRKSEIIRFMVGRGLEWREDASNASDKYMRNRVRNELMPLLKDLVKGEDVLERRLENLQEQSRKVKEDLAYRAHTYIDTANNDIEKRQSFPVPDHMHALSLVEEQAIHNWVVRRSNGRMHLSYDKLMAICRQVVNHPKRRRWKIAVGSGWDIVRNGNVLELLRDENDIDGAGQCEGEVAEAASKDNPIEGWVMESTTNTLLGNTQGDATIQNINETSLCINVQIDKTYQSSACFTLKSVGGNEVMTFLPPWRRGKTPIKIKEFLRGQKIPLHRRDCAPIICFSDGSSSAESVVAIFVEDARPFRKVDGSGSQKAIGERWIVHADFEIDCNSLAQKETIVLRRCCGASDSK